MQLQSWAITLILRIISSVKYAEFETVFHSTLFARWRDYTEQTKILLSARTPIMLHEP